MADAVLRYRITADDDSSVVFKKVGDSLQTVDKRFKDTTKGAKSLGAQIDDTTKRVASMRDEFKRTGDTDLLKSISKGERDLKRLHAWQEVFHEDTDTSVKKVGRLDRAMNSAGDSLSRAFPTSSAFFNPTILGAAAAAAALLAIPAGAAIAGAALAGLGAGFIGLGAFALRESKIVKDSATSLGITLNKTLTDAAKPLETQLARGLNIVRGTIRGLGPDLQGMFADVAPHVDNLAGGVDEFAHRVMPGLKRAVQESGDVLDDFAAKLPETGDAISAAFTSISDESEGAARGLTTAMGGLNYSIEQVGGTLALTSKGLEFFTVGAGKNITGVLGPWVKSLGDVEKKTKNLHEVNIQSADDYFKVARGMGDTTLKGDQLLGFFDRYNGEATNMEHANINVARSVANVSETLKESKGSLNNNTEAGRNARGALLGLVEGYKGQLQLLKDSGAPLSAIEGKYRNQAAALQALGVKLGVSKKDMADFIALVFNMPTSAAVVVTTPHLAASYAAVSNFRHQVETLPQAKNIHVDAPNAQNAKAQLEHVEDAALRIPTKRHTVVSTNANPGALDDTRQKLNLVAKPRKAPVSATPLNTGPTDSVLNRISRGRTTPISVFALAGAANAAINAAARARTATIYVRTVATLGPRTLSGPQLGSRIDRSAQGNVFSYADGGVQAMLAGPGTIHQWAEPSTGGEAFIPRLGDRKRSVSILEHAAGWYGMDVAPQPGRAPVGGAPSAGAGSRVGSLVINVNGPVRSESDALNQLTAALDKLRAKGRLPRGFG